MLQGSMNWLPITVLNITNNNAKKNDATKHGQCGPEGHLTNHFVNLNQNQSTNCDDIVTFPFFKMAAGHYLGFLNSRNLTS